MVLTFSGHFSLFCFVYFVASPIIARCPRPTCLFTTTFTFHWNKNAVFGLSCGLFLDWSFGHFNLSLSDKAVILWNFVSQYDRICAKLGETSSPELSNKMYPRTTTNFHRRILIMTFLLKYPLFLSSFPSEAVAGKHSISSLNRSSISHSSAIKLTLLTPPPPPPPPPPPSSSSSPSPVLDHPEFCLALWCCTDFKLLEGTTAFQSSSLRKQPPDIGWIQTPRERSESARCEAAVFASPCSS